MKKVLSLLTTLALTASTTSTLVGCENNDGTSEGAIFIKLGDNPSVTIPYQLKDHTLIKSATSNWNTPGENNLKEVANQLKSKYKITDNQLNYISIRWAAAQNYSFDQNIPAVPPTPYNTKFVSSGSDFIMRDLSPYLYYSNTNDYKILKITMQQPTVNDFSKVWRDITNNGAKTISITKKFANWGSAPLSLKSAKNQYSSTDLKYHNFMYNLFQNWITNTQGYKMPPFFTSKDNWTEAASNPGVIDKTQSTVTFNWVMKAPGTTSSKNFTFKFKDNS